VRRPGGEIVSFDVPGGLGTSPSSINDVGAITGSYTANGRFFGFVRDPHGKFTSFDPAPFTVPTSINNEGAITGYVFAVSIHPEFRRGFVRSPEGTITLFDAFCGIGTSPTSINDEGVIIGGCVVVGLNAASWVRFP